MSTKSFFQKPVSDLNYEDIQSLVEQKIPESHILDYKQDNYKDTSELAKDICAFANTNGGYLILGVKEERKKKNPEDEEEIIEPLKIVGIDDSPDLIKHLCDRIIPSVSSSPLVQFSELIPIPDLDKVLLVIYVPKSFDSLHMVMSGKHKSKYFMRYHDQNQPMDEYTVRTRYEMIRRGEKIVEIELLKKMGNITELLPSPVAGLVIGVTPINVTLKVNDLELVKNIVFNYQSNSPNLEAYYKMFCDSVGSTRPIRKMEFIEKIGNKDPVDNVVRFYYDGSVIIGSTRIFQSPRDSGDSYLMSNHLCLFLFHFLGIFSEFFSRIPYHGYLKLVIDIKGLKGSNFHFDHSTDPSFRREHSPKFQDEYPGASIIIETTSLLNNRKELINEWLLPLINEANLGDHLDKFYWNDKGEPK